MRIPHHNAELYSAMVQAGRQVCNSQGDTPGLLDFLAIAEASYHAAYFQGYQDALADVLEREATPKAFHGEVHPLGCTCARP
jgi:hypothetical protein